jgi:hypothetical protein
MVSRFDRTRRPMTKPARSATARLFRPANDNPAPARQPRVPVQSLPIWGRIIEDGLVVPLQD